MKNLQSIRKYYFIMFFLMGAATLFSQQVTVNFNILPPYSPFIRDYMGYLDNSKTIVTLTYMNAASGTPLRVYLQGSLRKDDNSISVLLKDNYRPGIPITLLPNIPQTLTGPQLRTLFGNGTSNDLEIKGVTMQDVAMNQAIPEGTYTFCIRVKEYESRILLAETCRPMFIAHAEPPQIISPFNNTVEIAKTPQFLLISWTPVTPFTRGTTYRLRLIKLIKGLSPYDAIRNSTQIVLEKSNIRTTSYTIDLASGVKLDTGAVYVLQVTGITPEAYIKNDGKSEPVQFLYKGAYDPAKNTLATTGSSDFTFLNPKPSSQPDTLKVGNDSSLLINWCWTKLVNDTLRVNDKEVIQTMGIQKYVLDINKNSKTNADQDKTFTFSREFQKTDSSGMIRNFLELNDSATAANGFEDGAMYAATLSYYDANNKLIGKKTSNDFIFKRLKDEEPVIQVSVQAVVKYGFKDFPEIYPVVNTEITVEALKAVGPQLPANEILSKLPVEKIGNKNFVSVATKVATSDTLGRITTKIGVPEKYFDTDSLYYRLKISNKYYVDKDFGVVAIPVAKKDTIVGFGQIIAKTYAYKLRLNVSKHFAAYKLTRDEKGLTVQHSEGALLGQSSSNTAGDKSQSYTYDLQMDTVAPGVLVVVYRENKQNHIPAWEGEITKNEHATGGEITVVAVGVTQTEKDSSYVTFERLLSTSRPDQEYKLLAIKNLDELLNTSGSGAQIPGNLLMSGISNKTITPALNTKIGNIITNITQNGTSTNFVDSAKFIAEPMPFKLPLPENPDAADVYYRTVKASYSITSCKPPTSILRGRLFYTWKSDGNQVKRPLANTHFRVMVDYVDGKNNNKSIGAVTNTNSVLTGISYGKWEYTSFQADNSSEVIPLVDQYATMAEGTTDNEGNFKIEVVNLNRKGSLGAGKVRTSEGSSKPPITGQSLKDKLKEQLEGGIIINPVDQSAGQFTEYFNQNNGPQNAGIQGTLNGSKFSIGFDAGSMSYEVQVPKKTGGAMTPGLMDVMYAPIDETGHGPLQYSPAYEPELPPETSTTYTQYADFKRMFRIVIDGEAAPYYYPSANVIEIQPFENQAVPLDITHFVKEFHVKAFTYDAKSKTSLSGMQVTLFRGPDKPGKLPLGEGDGKYTYKELNSPEYDAAHTHVETSAKDFKAGFDYTAKYEQLWPSQGVQADINQTYSRFMPALLQSEYANYFVQSSSYVNTGSQAYKATILEIPVFEDKTSNWADPQVTVVELPVFLNPLLSRALVRVKDSVSKKNLTTDQHARVIISTESSMKTNKTKFTDKYGYAEMLADDIYTLGAYVNDTNQADIYFFATADGYKFSTQQEKQVFRKFGTQAAPVLALLPTARIKGRVINADAATGSNTGNYALQSASLALKGVPCYLQADSGKIFETDGYGNFDIPIAPLPGTRFKIIPKDVAWFDTAHVLSVADSVKQLIDLENIKVYRRKHRLLFNVTQKMPVGFAGPATPVSGASIQLGETVKTTAPNGSAKFEFENVSVNNYTFVIKGPEGQGYIPKTLTLKSIETKDFETVNVLLEKGSEITGTVTLDGNPVKNARVYIDVANTASMTLFINYENSAQNLSSQANIVNNSGTPSNMGTQTNVTNNQVLGTASGNKASGKIGADANLVVAFTDSQGKFKLQGVPVDNQKINILATLDTAFTVVGDKQQADIKNGTATVNLKLASFGQALINKLYGFPLTVEKITPLTNTQVKVTGLVHWTEAISDFNLQEVNKVLRVEDVLFDLVTKNNVTTGVAHENTVEIPGITSIKLSYLNKYNVSLSKAGSQTLYNTQPLAITRENDYGKISGKMKIVDNSFNYPSSYLSFTGSEFYFAKLNDNRLLNNTLNTGKHVNNIISVATSAFTETESMDISLSKTDNYRKSIDNKINNYLQQQAKPVYYLCDKNADSIQFKLINFNAKADPAKSYIDKEGKIHLNTQLTCHIDKAQPEDFRLNIPDMILDENKVYPAGSGKPISLSLEAWTLEARNWQFSTTEGGIVSTDALIRTKIVDIPVGKFVLRSDMFLMDNFKMNKLSMAGGKFPLLEVDSTKAALVYEYKVGSDMKPHWNFCLLGGGSSKVASLPPLIGLPGYKIDLNYIEILSNNEMIVQLMQKPVKPLLQGNKMAKFEPLGIFNGPDYISVSGLMNIGAPRMSDIPLSVSWTATDKLNAIEILSIDFEAKGFVHFEAPKQKIALTKDLITITGKVLEKPDKTFNPLPASFFARSNGTPAYEIMIQKDWVTQLSEAEPDGIVSPKTTETGYSLKINSGGLKVENDDWTTLKYTGLMTNNNKATATDNITETNTTFEVLGAVSANSDSVSLSGVSTPFGAMTQTFDFKKKELVGSLKITTEITLGTSRLHSGTIETCFGAEGFYVAGGCYAFIPAGIFTGDYNLGFMAGSYKLTDHLWNVTNSYIDPLVRNVCYKQNTPRLSGCFLAFNREIINKSLDFDYVIAAGYVKAVALLGGDIYVNASDGFKLGGEGYAHVDVRAGLSAVTGTSISGGITGQGKIMFQIASKEEESYFDALIRLAFNASLQQDLGVKTISKSVSVDCVAKGGTSGFSFETGSGGTDLSCPPPAAK